MGKRRHEDKAASRHEFGGDWTTAKLDVLAQYLASYTTALKDKPFTKGYIDAFAGTGYRDVRREDAAEKLSQALLFPELAETEPQAFLDGSTRLALKTEPRFDRYVFIERSAERCAQLEALKSEFPHLASDIQIRRGAREHRDPGPVQEGLDLAPSGPFPRSVRYAGGVEDD